MKKNVLAVLFGAIVGASCAGVAQVTLPAKVMINPMSQCVALGPSDQSKFTVTYATGTTASYGPFTVPSNDSDGVIACLTLNPK